MQSHSKCDCPMSQESVSCETGMNPSVSQAIGRNSKDKSHQFITYDPIFLTFWSNTLCMHLYITCVSFLICFMSQIWVFVSLKFTMYPIKKITTKSIWMTVPSPQSFTLWLSFAPLVSAYAATHLLCLWRALWGFSHFLKQDNTLCINLRLEFLTCLSNFEALHRVVCLNILGFFPFLSLGSISLNRCTNVYPITCWGTFALFPVINYYR